MSHSRPSSLSQLQADVEAAQHALQSHPDYPASAANDVDQRADNGFIEQVSQPSFIKRFFSALPSMFAGLIGGGILGGLVGMGVAFPLGLLFPPLAGLVGFVAIMAIAAGLGGCAGLIKGGLASCFTMQSAVSMFGVIGGLFLGAGISLVAATMLGFIFPVLSSTAAFFAINAVGALLGGVVCGGIASLLYCCISAACAKVREEVTPNLQGTNQAGIYRSMGADARPVRSVALPACDSQAVTERTPLVESPSPLPNHSIDAPRP